MAEFDRKNYNVVHRDWEAYPPRNFMEKVVAFGIRNVLQPMIYLKSKS